MKVDCNGIVFHRCFLSVPYGGVCPEGAQLMGSPRLLHYSASLHLVDMLPPPPVPPPTEDTHSLSSDEG